MTFSLNALLEGATTSRRETIVNDFLARSTCGWTLPSISCDGEDDQNRLERFLGKFPPLVDALARRIASAPAGATEATAPSQPPGPAAVQAASFEDGTVRRTGGPQAIQIRLAGLGLQLLGILTAVWGIIKTWKQFELGDPPERFKNWIRRCGNRPRRASGDRGPDVIWTPERGAAMPGSLDFQRVHAPVEGIEPSTGSGASDGFFPPANWPCGPDE
jgi:hypothetical protein